MEKCSVDGCEKRHHAKGYCQMHYVRFKKHGSPYKTLPVGRNWEDYKEEVCSIQDCDKKYFSSGYCQMHYRRWKRNGDPLVVKEKFGRNNKASTE